MSLHVPGCRSSHCRSQVCQVDADAYERPRTGNVLGQFPAQICIDVVQQPGDLHLADADHCTDLSLRCALDEAQPQNQPFSLVETFQCGLQKQSGVTLRDPVPGIANSFSQRGRLLGAGQRCVQGKDRELLASP